MFSRGILYSAIIVMAAELLHIPRPWIGLLGMCTLFALTEYRQRRR